MFTSPLRLSLFPYTTLFRSVSANYILQSGQRYTPVQAFSAFASAAGNYYDIGFIGGFAGERAKRLDRRTDRKSTRLNSSHQIISYAVFCLKKKKKHKNNIM